MSGISGLEPQTPAWLLLLPLAPVAFWLERRAGRTRFRATLRAVLVAVLVLAAAQPAPLATAAPMAMVVDASASVDESAAGAMKTAAAVARIPVLTFGDDAATDIGQAIDAGSAALPDGGRLLLATDGRATRGRAIAAAARARRANIQVDVLPLAPSGGPDAGVVSVGAPKSWRAGDPLTVAITLGATQPLSTTLRVFRDDQLVATTAMALEGGLTIAEQLVPVPPSVRGAMVLRAEVESSADAAPENDTGYALVRVAGPPRVLVVGDGVAGVALADHLTREGVPAEVAAPEFAPVGADQWALFDAVALVDVPAGRLSPEQLDGLSDHVKSGAGLLLTAGRQSFALGGWAGTPLAELSPLELEPPEGGERDPVALVLVIDKSASMAGAAMHPSVTKLDIAREAAALAVEVLAPGDEAGVLAYDDEPEWVAPLAPVTGAGDITRIGAALAGIGADGGTRILPALQAGIDAVAGASAATKHVLLMTDGQDSSPDPAAFQAAAHSAHERGISLSTIALGDDADTALLSRMAEIGHGRAHLAPDAAALPRLTIEESRMVAGRSERTGEFRPVPAAPHPLTAGLDLDLPPLRGYLAAKAKPDSEIALETPAGDPLLADRAFGLGAVAGWMSDTGEDWGKSWVSDPGAAVFWAAILRRLARGPGDDAAAVAVTVADGLATIRVDARDPSGAPLDLADVTLVMTATTSQPGVESSTAAMRQVAPGAYEARIPTAPGVVETAVVVSKDDGRQVIPSGWAWNGPLERRTFTGGAPQLAAIARSGGGSVLATLPDLDAGEPLRVPPWLFLVAIAALMWLFDVADQLGVRLRRRPRSTSAPNLAPDWRQM